LAPQLEGAGKVNIIAWDPGLPRLPCSHAQEKSIIIKIRGWTALERFVPPLLPWMIDPGREGLCGFVADPG